MASCVLDWHPQTASAAVRADATANNAQAGHLAAVTIKVFPMIPSPKVTRIARKHTLWRGGSLPVLVPLVLEKRTVDMLGIKIDICGRHPALSEMILPAIHYSHHRAHLVDGFVLRQ